MTDHDLAAGCRFDTVRLSADEWRRQAERHKVDLVALAVDMMTPATTRGLPELWQGSFTVERAQAWIEERNSESPTLLVIERSSGRAIGLLILFETPDNTQGCEMRIGYLFEEASWGQGYARELVAGLVAWAQMEAGIHSLTGGVAANNPASVRVLESNGFFCINGQAAADGEAARGAAADGDSDVQAADAGQESDPDAELTYQLVF